MIKEELINTEVKWQTLKLLTKDELIERVKSEQDFRLKLQEENQYLRALNEELKARLLLIEDKYILIKNKFYGKSSERLPKKTEKTLNSNKGDKKNKKVLLPSQRYPDVPLIERDVVLQNLPNCSFCGAKMQDSGMTENSEFLTVLPQQYLVIRQKRHKYRCKSCYGDIQTAPAPARIKEGSTYSDDMIIDVAMTKYCDLVPIERYTAIAGRAGLKDLPPHSLIESTHYLADFVKGAYSKLEAEIKDALVLHADETPHRMLEGDKKSNWYLWGFSTPKTSYFEHHNTRSGDVASQLLVDSKCCYLVSDVFSGYAKAVREANEVRKFRGTPKILNSYCNAHARRKFKEAVDSFGYDAQYFVDQYDKIYHLESGAQGKPPDNILVIRQQMALLFEAVKARASELLKAYPSKSSIGKAMSYFLENYEGFTLFLTTKNPLLPIDNNSQERLLRSPVIGRKTWYGTHSKRGAMTASILFSLVESCKLNKINPRTYFKNLVQDLLAGKPAYTPKEVSSI